MKNSQIWRGSCSGGCRNSRFSYGLRDAAPDPSDFHSFFHRCGKLRPGNLARKGSRLYHEGPGGDNPEGAGCRQRLTLFSPVRYDSSFSRVSRPGRESNEAYFSTQPSASAPHARVSSSDAHEERAHCPQAPSGQRPQTVDRLRRIPLIPNLHAGHFSKRADVASVITTAMPLTRGPDRRLRSRADFTAVREQGRRVQTRHLTVLALCNALGRDRLGIIASRRLGGAVLRNRVKRRVREVFRLRADRPEHAPGFRTLDVVVIPRREVATAPFTDLAAEFGSALGRLRGTRAS